MFSCKERVIRIGKWVKSPCCLDAVRKELPFEKHVRVGENNRKSRNSCELRGLLILSFRDSIYLRRPSALTIAR